MAVIDFKKKIQDIMRNDPGVNGDAQRIEQIIWILFLKIYDSMEVKWKLFSDSYESIIPKKFRWQNWAKDNKDGESLTGDSLLNFVNNELFPALKNLEIGEHTETKQRIVREVFEDINNYQKDGILLRQVINVIDEIDFLNYEESQAFVQIYESFLKDLQSAGNAGEFYTPRAVTDFMVKVIKPTIGERIADFACGTGGFLKSALDVLKNKISSVEGGKSVDNAVYGIEKKSLPYILCVTNLIHSGIEVPDIEHDNALGENYKDLRKKEKFDIILMNPPYGGNEKENIKQNFPYGFRSSETADLFMNLIMYRLKENGRCGIIIPDGFLFGNDNIKINIKKKLFGEFNLHTVVRLPKSVFAPYTGITTNILFFDKTGPTKETWFYRVDMPKGYKNFSKTKPMKIEHFGETLKWWDNREELEINGYPKAKKYSIGEIEERNFNIDLCGYIHEKEEILEPSDLISKYEEKREKVNERINELLKRIISMIGGN